MTSRLADGTALPTARSRRLQGLERFTVAVPDRVLLLAVSAILATSVTVQLEIFHPYVLFPVFLVLAAALWRLVPTSGTLGRQVHGPTGADPRTRSPWYAIGSVVAVVAVLSWMLVQRHFYSELLAVRRDPAIYTLRGFWLMDHASPDVTLTQQLLDIKRAVPAAGLDFGTETFRLTRYFQSTTVVPGLIAVAGWIGGPSLLLQGDVLIGGAALLCVYAVARRLAGPVLGLVPVAALGLSMPMVGFTRVAYTEPVSIIAVMACLLGLWQAARHRRPAGWLLAGVGAGGVAITRIDGAR